MKLSKKSILGILLLAIIAGGIPLTLSQSQVQQVLTGRAWSTSQSANAICDPNSGIAIINVRFTNEESSRSMIVTAVDNQSGESTSLGTIEPKKSQTGKIDTQKTSLNSGQVKFKLAWADNPSSTDSRTASYSSVSKCVTPTPTPTPPLENKCPTGTQEVGKFSGGPLLANGEPSSKTHTFNLSSSSKITILGSVKEGHPEDCPNGPLCKQGQKFEEITVSLNDSKVGETTDQGDVDAWLPAGPWETSSAIDAGTVNLLVEHRKRSTAGPESVDYELTACAGEAPTPTPTPTPTACPTPGTVKNVQIQCPYCTPSPSPNQ